MTILGTRPEIIKLSRVIGELDRHTDHVLVHTGQNYDYELNEIFFRDLGSAGRTTFWRSRGDTGGDHRKRDHPCRRDNGEGETGRLPDPRDTNSCLSAIPAKRRKIPVFHMGGREPLLRH